MPVFFFTFGEKYGSEPHPKFGAAHPDGYVRIQANDWESARACAFDNLGPYWSWQYDEQDFDASCYPRGVILELEAQYGRRAVP